MTDKNLDAAHLVVTYTVSLTIRLAVDDEDDPAEYVTQKAKTALERDVLRCLRQLNAYCDCEVMAATTTAEDR